MGLFKGDTRSFDFSSFGLEFGLSPCGVSLCYMASWNFPRASKASRALKCCEFRPSVPLRLNLHLDPKP